MGSPHQMVSHRTYPRNRHSRRAVDNCGSYCSRSVSRSNRTPRTPRMHLTNHRHHQDEKSGNCSRGCSCRSARTCKPSAYFPAMLWGWQRPAQEPAFAAREVPMGYRGRAGTGGRVVRLGVAIALNARGLKGCDVARSLLAQADLYLLASMSRRVRPLVLAP